MKNKRTYLINLCFGLGLSLGLSSCATFFTTSTNAQTPMEIQCRNDKRVPYIYAGVRSYLRLYNDETNVQMHEVAETPAMKAALIAGSVLDFPVSLLADTAILPITYFVEEQYQQGCVAIN